MGAGMPKSLDEIAKICSTESVWHNVNFKIPMLIKALKAGAVHEPSAEELGTVHVDLDGSDFWQIIIFLEDLIETKRENEELKQILGKAFDKFARAIEAYNDTSKRHSTRSANALKILGFSQGKRPAKFNKRALIDEYLDLIYGTGETAAIILGCDPAPPLGKWEAIERLTEKHGIASKFACFQLLKEAMAERGKECAENGCPDHGWHNMLPGNWPEI